MPRCVTETTMGRAWTVRTERREGGRPRTREKFWGEG
jgi:hypothetical protein